jgi:hypothetical protein
MSEEFEEWVSDPPIDANISKYGLDSSWPGQYRKYSVQLAYDAWNHQQSKLDAKDNIIDEQAKKITDLEIINDNLSSSNRQIAELLDAKDKELTALRGFSNDVIDNDLRELEHMYDSAMHWGLLNDDSSKTVTLTGDKNER